MERRRAEALVEEQKTAAASARLQASEQAAQSSEVIERLQAELLVAREDSATARREVEGMVRAGAEREARAKIEVEEAAQARLKASARQVAWFASIACAEPTARILIVCTHPNPKHASQPHARITVTNRNPIH